MLKKILLNTSFILVILFLLPQFSQSLAASLKFVPDKVTADSSETFDVKVDVDTSGEKILAVDARILYPSNILEVVTIKDGQYLTIADKDTTEAGKIYIAGIVENPATAQTGAGTLVTITFKGKSDGAGKLKFECTAGVTGYDSDISKNDINTTDIIVCSQNGESDITVGEGTASPTSTPTPKPTSAAGETSGDSSTETSTSTEENGEQIGGVETTPTPTALPKAGADEAVFKFVAPGALLLLIGVGARLLLL